MRYLIGFLMVGPLAAVIFFFSKKPSSEVIFSSPQEIRLYERVEKIALSSGGVVNKESCRIFTKNGLVVMCPVGIISSTTIKNFLQQDGWSEKKSENTLGGNLLLYFAKGSDCILIEEVPKSRTSFVSAGCYR